MAYKFSALDPGNYYDLDNITKLTKLAEIYLNDIESVEKVLDEFHYFKGLIKNIVNTKKKHGTYKEICKEVMATNSNEKEVNINTVLKVMIANDWCYCFPNLTILYKIYMTLPISSAAAERSFSRLKSIKHYNRSTMNQDRLASLALISIEKEFADEVDIDNVINHFANMKPRRKRFQ